MARDAFEFNKVQPITIVIGNSMFRVQPSDVRLTDHYLWREPVITFIDRERDARFVVHPSHIVFMSQPIEGT